MKKFVFFIIIALGILVASCKTAEPCPAYSEAVTVFHSVNS